MSTSTTGSFESRVDFAARVIASGRETTRNFSNCFEMNDGEHVVEALRRRAQRNPRLAQALPRYIRQESVEAAEATLGHLTREQLIANARETRERRSAAFAEQIKARRAVSADPSTPEP
ncbi:hypothetical protein J2T57_001445 [Natronocella acetinitrilica]|uniref:Uncharacterized protein n=1 Tax=Natronocella acetinitrilica TaxID=414046 RepID=A0AAE3KC03_9GAMM|nr:hypothetical protein [Natronocella acetinitrilica]MCP1674343.1 hypothetical protein [Natronocella acetinitrilica]